MFQFLRNPALLVAAVLAGTLSAVGAQPVPCPANRQQAETSQSLIEKARAEIRQFNEAGGKPEDPNHPAVRWSEILWGCREAWSGTPAAAEVTAEAVHILVHAARPDRAMELADTVPPEDPAWESLLNFVFEAAERANDVRGCVRRVESLLPHWRDSQQRARASLILGQAYRRLDESDKAADLYEQVQREVAGTPLADRAANALRQIRQLNPGQPAPDFEAPARDGVTLALAGFRGRAVVLIFWSTT